MKRPAPVERGGLHLSVVRGPNTDGRWYWRARDQDRKTVWTGWASRVEAIRALRELTGEAEPPPTLVTVEDLLRVWVAARSKDPELSPSTQDNYRRMSAHPLRLLGSLPLAKLDHSALETFRNTRLGEGSAPRSLRAELTLIRLAWRWAIGRELLHAPPLPPIKLKARGYVLNHRTPTEPEVTEVLAHMRGEAQGAAQVLAVTGARIAEVLGLKRRDLDLAQGLLKVRGKSGCRSIPLTPGLRVLLESRADDSDAPLFAVTEAQLREAITRACAETGCAPFTPHGLRRMVVNRLARSGVDPKVAAAITGHSVEVMLEIYRSVSPEEKARGVRQAGLGQRLTIQSGDGQSVSGAQVGAQRT